MGCVINGVPCESYGLHLEEYEIGVATPNTKYIEVPGRDGKIDVTDFTGLTFKNRDIKLSFNIKDRNVYSQRRLQLERLNGTKVRLQFENDMGVFWVGRIQLTEYKRKTVRYCDVSMTQDADPFPYSVITGDEVRDVSDLD